MDTPQHDRRRQGDRDYEDLSRLADSEQHQQIADIIGIPTTELTNTGPLQSPLRAGAGRVNPFIIGNKVPFLSSTSAPSSTASNSTNAQPSTNGSSVNNGTSINNGTSANNGPSPSASPRDGRGNDSRKRQKPRDNGTEEIEIQTLNTQGQTNNTANQSKNTTSPPANKHVAGYRALADFVSTDNVFRIFRRFDAMTVRTLLYLQDELCELEERLQALDDADFASTDASDLISLHSRRNDKNVERKTIMADIQRKLKEYHEGVAAYANVIALEKPQHLYVESLKNWMDGKKPTVEAESHFLDVEEDLLSMFLPGSESGNRVMETFIEAKFSQLFETKKHKARSSDPNIQYYSKKTIRRVVRTILTTIAVALLIGPVVALNYINLIWVKLLLIAIFSLCFALALALWTRSRNHEIFAALATYCAVLVIFVSNSPSNGD